MYSSLLEKELEWMGNDNVYANYFGGNEMLKILGSGDASKPCEYAKKCWIVHLLWHGLSQ